MKNMKKINKLNYWKERWQNNDPNGRKLFKIANNIGNMLDKKILKKTSSYFTDIEKRKNGKIILKILQKYSYSYNK